MPAILRRATATSVVGLLFWTGFPALQAQAAPPTCDTHGACSVEFSETGSPQSFTVPDGVDSLSVVVDAGSGGTSNDAETSHAYGGAGGEVQADIPVTAGDVLSIVVGAAGGDPVVSGVDAGPVGTAPGGYGGGGAAGMTAAEPPAAGGGGGGGSFIFDTTAGSLLVAAGGGGGGSSSVDGNGGDGGSAGDDADGQAAADIEGRSGALGGGGATGASAGAGGQPKRAGTPGTDGDGPATDDTHFGAGGDGASSAGNGGTAGGGGGGYYGGGGGGTNPSGTLASGGGGGSGFLASNATLTGVDANVGDGNVLVEYTKAATTVTLSAPGHATSGSSVRLRASVSSPAGAPRSGSVKFTLADGTVLGTATIVNGVATLQVTLPVGSQRIVASFAGSPGRLAAASTPAAVAVAAAPTTSTHSQTPTASASATPTAVNAGYASSPRRSDDAYVGGFALLALALALGGYAFAGPGRVRRRRGARRR